MKTSAVSAAANTGTTPVRAGFGFDVEAIIGGWFYVVDMVEGRVFWGTTFPDVPAKTRPVYFQAMNDALARLHMMEPEEIGPGDYGPAGNCFERQISRWSRSFRADTDAGRDPGMDRLVEWLPAAIPQTQGNRIVHGDVRCDILIYHPTEPRVVAVLGWELSPLGCPRADISNHAMRYRTPPETVAGLGHGDPTGLSIPTESGSILHPPRCVPGRHPFPETPQ